MANVSKMLVCGGAVVVGLLVPVTATAAAEGDGFDGSWTSVDTDGSHQVLAVHGGGSPRRAATLFDDSASTCGGAPARLSGSAQVDGDTLVLRGALTCLPGGNPLRGAVSVEFTHDATTDTLLDQFGVTWDRFD